MVIHITKDKFGNDVLQLEAPLTENKQSRSGNSTIIASTRGQQYVGKIRGKDTYVQLNVMQMEAAGGIQVDREGAESTSAEVEAIVGRGTGSKKAA